MINQHGEFEDFCDVFSSPLGEMGLSILLARRKRQLCHASVPSRGWNHRQHRQRKSTCCQLQTLFSLCNIKHYKPVKQICSNALLLHLRGKLVRYTWAIATPLSLDAIDNALVDPVV